VHNAAVVSDRLRLLMIVLIAVYPLYLSTFLARKAVIPRQALSKRVAFLIEAVDA
jgi:hypothetical protein